MLMKFLLTALSISFASCAGLQNTKTDQKNLASDSHTAESVAIENTVIKFRIATSDAKGTLSVSLTLPDRDADQYPLVIMVPGTGLFDADVNLGVSGTPEDLIFVEIEKNLLGLGYAVMRFSPRGIYCNLYNKPECPVCKNKADVEKHFLNTCFDFDIRKSVTPQTMQSDLLSVYKWANEQSSINSKKIVMFGHSEGSIHISKLVEKNLIQPDALIFMGGLAESPVSGVKWQNTDRITDAVMSFDKNGDQKVTTEEIRVGLPDSLIRFFTPQQLYPPDGHWARESLSTQLEEQYQAMKSDVLSKSDRVPFGSGAIVQASYKWWKMWFTDETRVVDSLKNYKGTVIYNNGTHDSQTPALRQKEIFDRVKRPNWDFVVYEDKGHSLGLDIIAGPVADDSMLLLMHSFKFEGL